MHSSAFLPLTDVNPASVQAFHSDIEALSFLTQPVGHWHGAVLKNHRSCRLRIPTHLKDGRTRGRQTVNRYCHLVVETSLEKKNVSPFFLFCQSSALGFPSPPPRKRCPSALCLLFCTSRCRRLCLRLHWWRPGGRSRWGKPANAEFPAHCELEQPRGHLRAVEDVVVTFSLRRGQQRRCITAAAWKIGRNSVWNWFLTRNLWSKLAKCFACFTFLERVCNTITSKGQLVMMS